MAEFNNREEIHYRIYLITLGLIAVTMPFSLFANSLSIILLFINWLLEGNFRQKIESCRNNLFLLLFVSFFLLHLTGLIYTSNVEHGFFDIQRKLSLLVLPLIIATSRPIKENHLHMILKVFFYTIFSASIICLGYATYRTDLLNTYPNINWLCFSYRDLTSIIKLQPTYLAIYTSFTIFILFYFLLKNRLLYSTLKKALIILLILYFTGFMFLLASRTTLATLILISFTGILYFFIKNNQCIKGLFILATVSVFLGILMYQIPVIRERTLQMLGIEQNLEWINQYGDGTGKVNDGRIKKWECAWNIIRENWLFGVGTGDDQEELQIQYKLIDLTDAYEAQYNAHNQYLQSWIGIGLAGLILLILMLVKPILLAWRKREYLCLSFLFLISISFFTESMLCRQQGVVFYALFNSIFVFHIINKNKTEDPAA